jgi:hypothetical protein
MFYEKRSDFTHKITFHVKGKVCAQKVSFEALKKVVHPDDQLPSAIKKKTT